MWNNIKRALWVAFQILISPGIAFGSAVLIKLALIPWLGYGWGIGIGLAMAFILIFLATEFILLRN